jgi:hypothetical protein
MQHCSRVHKQEIIIEKSPLSLLYQRGVYFLPLAKGGEKGFYNQCLHTYDSVRISIQLGYVLQK